MEFDIKVRGRFVKRGMGRRRDNPLSDRARFSTYMRERNGTKGVHFRLANPFYVTCPVAVRLNRHENGLSPARCRRTCAGGVAEHP